MTRLEYVQNKIVDLESTIKKIATWRLKNEKVVFTNGCFDILHKGHVTYLAQAAELGNKMIVALNTDASVQRQGKGEERPINKNDARAMVLASLGFVDAIVFFNDDTPLSIIKELKPDVLVKGADYDPSEVDENSPKYIVGSNEVKAYGGDVKAIPLVEGFSTTGIIEKLKG